jgi:hypothetical protein
MISDAEFAVMKPLAVVINVGRGPVIDEAALLRALSANRIKGAGLDVFEHEPLPAGHPLYKLEISQPLIDNVLQWFALLKPAILLQKAAHCLILPIGRVVRAVWRQQNILSERCPLAAMKTAPNGLRSDLTAADFGARGPICEGI